MLYMQTVIHATMSAERCPPHALINYSSLESLTARSPNSMHVINAPLLFLAVTKRHTVSLLFVCGELYTQFHMLHIACKFCELNQHVNNS